MGQGNKGGAEDLCIEGAGSVSMIEEGDNNMTTRKMTEDNEKLGGVTDFLGLDTFDQGLGQAHQQPGKAICNVDPFAGTGQFMGPLVAEPLGPADPIAEWASDLGDTALELVTKADTETDGLLLSWAHVENHIPVETKEMDPTRTVNEDDQDETLTSFVAGLTSPIRLAVLPPPSSEIEKEYRTPQRDRSGSEVRQSSRLAAKSTSGLSSLEKARLVLLKKGGIVTNDETPGAAELAKFRQLFSKPLPLSFIDAVTELVGSTHPAGASVVSRTTDPTLAAAEPLAAA